VRKSFECHGILCVGLNSAFSETTDLSREVVAWNAEQTRIYNHTLHAK